MPRRGWQKSRGDLDAALVLYDAARRAYIKTVVPDSRPIEALKANVYLKQGRLAEAQDWARGAVLSADDEIGYLSEFEHLILARLLLVEAQRRQERGAFLQAIGLLERLLHAAEAQNRIGSVIGILVAQALAHQVQGNLPLALAALERALELAEPEGYLRLFVEEGEKMHGLLANLRSRLETPSSRPVNSLLGYVRKLLSAFERSGVTDGNAKVSTPDMLEPLSERELEVLRLVAQGLTNTEISQRLVLSVSTVKGHNLRIFAKLQAKNCSEAVMRARQLGLL